MSVQHPTYGFDALPIEPIDAGTNVLLTGPVHGGLRGVFLRLLLRTGPREGALFISSDTDCATTLGDYEELGGDLDAARIGAIDCTEDGTADSSRNIHAVSSPSDLTGVGIEFTGLYERLAANGARQVRTGLYTLTPLVVYADTRTVFRFLHTLTGRIRTADGFGVCAVDPSSIEEQSLSTFAQVFDGRIELRERDGDREIRVSGLDDQPDGWHPVDLD